MTRRRVAVVTGGTRGIGRAITLELARSGRHVFALYARNREAAQALLDTAASESLSIECLRADLTDEEGMGQCVASIRKTDPEIEVLIHSAASGVHRSVSNLTPKHLQWTLGVNVFAIHGLLSALLPYVPSGGRIIGITSSGSTRVAPCYAAVGTSKGALETLFRYYAQELAPRGIAVNVVCPGMVLTGALDAFPDKDARVQKSLEQTPTGRLTTPEDVGHVVAFLCSEVASQIIGQTIVVDGGRTLT
jgi:enoyl-[acyl-carrier protein] reductase III